MRLLNFRSGFSVNSSSDHSIIWVPNPDFLGEGEDLNYNDFGWQEFCLEIQNKKHST